MNRYDPLTSEFASAEEEAAYDVWFRKKVQEALDDPRPAVPHDEAMARVRATLEKPKLRAQQADICGFNQVCYPTEMNEYNPITSEFASAEEEASYDVWFRKKVAESLADNSPGIPHDEVMAEIYAIIEDARARKKEC